MDTTIWDGSVRKLIPLVFGTELLDDLHCQNAVQMLTEQEMVSQTDSPLRVPGIIQKSNLINVSQVLNTSDATVQKSLCFADIIKSMFERWSCTMTWSLQIPWLKKSTRTRCQQPFLPPWLYVCSLHQFCKDVDNEVVRAPPASEPQGKERNRRKAGYLSCRLRSAFCFNLWSRFPKDPCCQLLWRNGLIFFKNAPESQKTIGLFYYASTVFEPSIDVSVTTASMYSFRIFLNFVGTLLLSLFSLCISHSLLCSFFLLIPFHCAQTCCLLHYLLPLLSPQCSLHHFIQRLFTLPFFALPFIPLLSWH